VLVVVVVSKVAGNSVVMLAAVVSISAVITGAVETK
jgi:hypothetical protein